MVLNEHATNYSVHFAAFCLGKYIDIGYVSWFLYIWNMWDYKYLTSNGTNSARKGLKVKARAPSRGM